jgi:multiple sugar transport system ATP-binding protein
MNLVEATIDGNTIAFGQFRVPLSPRRRPPAGATRVVLGIRPEAFDDAAFAQGDLPRIDVTVEVLEELGSDSHVFFHVAAPRVAIETRSGSDDESTILAEHNSRFIARVNPGTRAVVGEPIELALNPASFHFFDVQTGESLLLADTGRQSAYEEALPG